MKIQIPYRIDFDRRRPGSFKPGEGNAGWTTWCVNGEKEAKSFLRRLPRQSWMPGTRRLAQKYGVKE